MSNTDASVAPLGKRELKKQAVREHILEETTRLVTSYGLEGATIDAICDGTDIAKKTFYNYYSSKHELLMDICQKNLLDRTRLLIDEAIKTQLGLSSQLDFIFAVMTERNRVAGKLERELIDYMISSLSENWSQGTGQLTFMNDCFKELYEQQQDKLKPEFNPTFCAEMTVAMINGLTLNWLHNDLHETESGYHLLGRYIKQSMLKS